MTINYLIKGSKNPSKLYCRFSHSRAVDIFCPLSIMLNPEYWDQKAQRVRNVIVLKNRDLINKNLTLLKLYLLDKSNEAYMSGDILDRQWMQEVINKFFNRPSQEVGNKNEVHRIYLNEFSEWWLKEKAPIWSTTNNTIMSKRDIGQYNLFLNYLNDFEKEENIKIKFKDVNNEIINKFSAFMISRNYRSQHIKRMIGRLKFFCFRADEENIEVNKNFKQRVFVPKNEDIKEAFLNTKEIEKIYQHDFSDNESLDNVRDNLIISVWTGLRVSDFMGKLKIDNFIDGFIEITTQKTSTPVTIPIHPMVRDILIKRNGQLPRKITDVNYNKYVKEVCKLAGLTNIMKGNLFDSKTNRKVIGDFAKYKLVSSHIGRRSFATNHFGKISNQVIMKVCGWSKEEMMLKYIKKSNREFAVELQKYWDSKI